MIASRNPTVTHRLANGRDVAFRFATEDDQSYVARTWVASVAGGHANLRHAMRETNRQVDRLLDDRATRVLVCCEPDDHRRILGWIASAGGVVAVLLYVNVRAEDRRQGIGAELARRADVGDRPVFLFRGPSADWMVARHPKAVHMTAEEYLTA